MLTLGSLRPVAARCLSELVLKGRSPQRLLNLDVGSALRHDRVARVSNGVAAGLRHRVRVIHLDPTSK
jgi:hypothetical protein